MLSSSQPPGLALAIPYKVAKEKLPRGRGELILVVDDEESIRMLMREILESHNYQVLEAKDGMEAVRLFKKHQSTVKVVITDMIMPELDGAATIRSIRELDDAIPIVATSGLTTEANRVVFAHS